jgi:hypothetical protein
MDQEIIRREGRGTVCLRNLSIRVTRVIRGQFSYGFFSIV